MEFDRNPHFMTEEFTMFNITTFIYLAAALIPPIFLLRFIYKQDKIEKEPIGLLLLLLVGGLISTFFASILEELGQKLLLNVLSLSPYSVIYHVLFAFLVVALAEEGCKLIFLYLFSWKRKAFNFVFDAVVYAVFVSLGFAALENVLYVFQGGLSVAASRAVLSIPGHLGFSIFMGVFYGRAKLCEVYGNRAGKKKNLWLALLYSVLVHGFYDACLMVGGTIPTIIFLVFVVVMYIYVFRLIKSAAFFDRPLV